MDYIISCNVTDLNYETLKEICTNGSDATGAECIKYDNKLPQIVRFVSGGWFFVISVLGIFGNLMTLVCIPFSARKKLYGFDKNFKVTTVFILFVSFVDFWRCLLYSLPYSLGLLTQKWFLGTFWCNLCTYVLVISEYLELVGLNLIGLTRYLGLRMSSRWLGWLDEGINSILVIMVTSLPSIILVIPDLTGFSTGWVCEVGACDTIYDKPTWDLIETGYFGFFTLTICLFYFLIWRRANNSSNLVQCIGNRKISKLYSRNIRMTRTILFLIFVSIICHASLVLCRLIKTFWEDRRGYQTTIGNTISYQILISIYETQFGFNFLMYAFTNEQYRNGYLAFWKYVTFQEIDGATEKMSNTRDLAVGKDTRKLARLPKLTRRKSW